MLVRLNAGLFLTSQLTSVPTSRLFLRDESAKTSDFLTQLKRNFRKSVEPHVPLLPLTEDSYISSLRDLEQNSVTSLQGMNRTLLIFLTSGSQSEFTRMTITNT